MEQGFRFDYLELSQAQAATRDERVVFAADGWAKAAYWRARA